MISHVSVCLLAHEEKGLISDTFRHTKWEYSFSVRPIGCTPAFSFYRLLNKLEFCVSHLTYKYLLASLMLNLSILSL